jgi:hypothetical protein
MMVVADQAVVQNKARRKASESAMRAQLEAAAVSAVSSPPPQHNTATPHRHIILSARVLGPRLCERPVTFTPHGLACSPDATSPHLCTTNDVRQSSYIAHGGYFQPRGPQEGSDAEVMLAGFSSLGAQSMLASASLASPSPFNFERPYGGQRLQQGAAGCPGLSPGSSSSKGMSPPAFNRPGTPEPVTPALSKMMMATAGSYTSSPGATSGYGGEEEQLARSYSAGTSFRPKVGTRLAAAVMMTAVSAK